MLPALRGRYAKNERSDCAITRPLRAQATHALGDIQTRVDLHSASNFFVGFSGDLADGGLFVATYLRFAAGERVRIECSLADGHQLCAEATVAWVCEPREVETGTTPGIGVSFVDLTPDDCHAIKRFMALREPMFVDHD